MTSYRIHWLYHWRGWVTMRLTMILEFSMLLSIHHNLGFSHVVLIKQYVCTYSLTFCIKLIHCDFHSEIKQRWVQFILKFLVIWIWFIKFFSFSIGCFHFSYGDLSKPQQCELLEFCHFFILHPMTLKNPFESQNNVNLYNLYNKNVNVRLLKILIS